jgi:hypothetical protein
MVPPLDSDVAVDSFLLSAVALRGAACFALFAKRAGLVLPALLARKATRAKMQPDRFKIIRGTTDRRDGRPVRARTADLHRVKVAL